MNFLIPFQMIYMIIITLLLINDFFPVSFLSHIVSPEVLLGVMIGLFLSVLFKKDGHTDHDVRIKAQLFYTMYLLSLVGVLTALGGRSTIGISLNDLFLWIVLLLSCCHTFCIGRKQNNLKHKILKGNISFEHFFKNS